MSEAAIAQKLSEVPHGSFRHNVLGAAKRFKASWVELGKLLVRVRDEALFTEWGFQTFEAYCSKELHIRKATADKLTRSFSFLAKHEPTRVANDDIVQTAPSFEVVEVLAGADERGQLSSDEYQQIRDSIWNPEKPVAELRREFAERYPRPVADPPAEDIQLRRFAQAARKLAQELKSAGKVNSAVAERAASLAEDLEALAAEVRGR